MALSWSSYLMKERRSVLDQRRQTGRAEVCHLRHVWVGDDFETTGYECRKETRCENFMEMCELMNKVMKIDKSVSEEKRKRKILVQKDKMHEKVTTCKDGIEARKMA